MLLNKELSRTVDNSEPNIKLQPIHFAEPLLNSFYRLEDTTLVDGSLRMNLSQRFNLRLPYPKFHLALSVSLETLRPTIETFHVDNGKHKAYFTGKNANLMNEEINRLISCLSRAEDSEVKPQLLNILNEYRLFGNAQSMRNKGLTTEESFRGFWKDKLRARLQGGEKHNFGKKRDCIFKDVKEGLMEYYLDKELSSEN